MSAVQDIGAEIARLGPAVLVKSLVIMAIVMVLFLATRRASAAVRHLVLVAGLGAVSFATAMSALVAVLPTATSELATLASPTQLVGDDAVTGTVHQVLGAAALAGAGPRAAPIALVWAAVAMVLLSRLAADGRAASSLVEASAPVTDRRLLQIRDRLAETFGLRSAPELRMSALVPVAATAGVLRPVVLLAPEALDWADERTRGVLAHELAHVARRDCFTQLLAGIVCAIHWPNPLCWWASRRLRAEREMAADDLALASGATASAYASDLLTFARAAGGRPRAAVLAIAGSPLGDRIGRLVDGRRSRRRVGRNLLWVAAFATMALTAPIACLRGAPDDAQDDGGSLWVALEANDDAEPIRTLFRGASADPTLRTRGLSVVRSEWKVRPAWEASGVSGSLTFVTGTEAALRTFVAALPSVAGHIVTLGQHDNGLWRTHVVDVRTRLPLNDHVVSLDRDEAGRPEVTFRFGPGDAARLRAFTAANLGRRLALVAGERVLAAPVLKSAISDKARITVGARDPAAAEKETRWLVEQLTGSRRI